MHRDQHWDVSARTRLFVFVVALSALAAVGAAGLVALVFQPSWGWVLTTFLWAHGAFNLFFWLSLREYPVNEVIGDAK